MWKLLRIFHLSQTCFCSWVTSSTREDSLHLFLTRRSLVMDGFYWASEFIYCTPRIFNVLQGLCLKYTQINWNWGWDLCAKIDSYHSLSTVNFHCNLLLSLSVLVFSPYGVGYLVSCTQAWERHAVPMQATWLRSAASTQQARSCRWKA